MTALEAVAHDEPEQLSLGLGPAIEGNAFSVRSASKIPTDRPRDRDSHVRGWFEGRVRAVLFDDGPTGGTLRLHLIEVLDAGLEG